MSCKKASWNVIYNFCKKIILCLIILFNAYAQLLAQNKNLIINGSLNGEFTDQIPPDGWDRCNDNDYNDTPDVTNYYSFGTGSHIISPVADSTLVILRARGINYNGGYYTPHTREYLSQNLKSPLQIYSCYKFSVYLATDFHMSVTDSLLENVSFPLVLKVWGANISCSREKLLFVTQTIKDTIWSKKEYNFTIGDTSYSTILIEVMWDTISFGQPRNAYNGLILLDSLSMVNTGIIDTIKTDTIYYKGDGKTTLVASKGQYYNWTPAVNLSGYNIQSPVMLEYYNQYKVVIGNASKCPSLEVFNIKFNCDTLYPNETIKTYYYKYFKKVVLRAANGVTFDWEPKTNLSAYDVQAPFLTGFQDKYIVVVKDKYSCVSQEEFNIFANCDSLYPSSNVLVLDTFFNQQSGILLVPKVGKIAGLWNPSRWLSCTDCQTPLATPEYRTTYTIYLVDSFECNHYESFKIDMPLLIPNVITPNGDGFNDCFKIIGVPENTIIRIFDKSGENVFSANNYGDSNCWKGKDRNGINLETGTYWYILDNRETGFFKKGFVFLKR